MLQTLIESVLRAFANWLYNFLQLSQEEWFQWVAFGWLLVGIIYELLHDKPTLKNLAYVMGAPMIDTQCTGEPQQDLSSARKYEGGIMKALYPRQFLEQLACRLTTFFTFPARKWLVPSLKQVANQIYDFKQENMQATFLALLFASFLAIFAYGDTIAIANALDALGLIRGEFPEALLYYERSVAAASFFAIVVGFFVLIETFAYGSVPQGTIEENSAQTAFQKRRQPLIEIQSPEMVHFLRGLSLIVVLLGIVVAVLLGIGRIQALGIWDTNQTLRTFVQVGVNVVSLVNGIIAAALVFTEGIRGLRVLLAAFIWVLILGLYLFDLVAFLGARVLMFVLDYVWRLALVFLLIFFFIAFRPAIALFDWFLRQLILLIRGTFKAGRK